LDNIKKVNGQQSAVEYNVLKASQKCVAFLAAQINRPRQWRVLFMIRLQESEGIAEAVKIAGIRF